MKNKLILTIFVLGVVAFAALGFAGEMKLLPESLDKWAPLALVGIGVLMLVIAWRCWGSLMAWVFGKDMDKMK